jgi:hypothetical protein
MVALAKIQYKKINMKTRINRANKDRAQDKEIKTLTTGMIRTLKI